MNDNLKTFNIGGGNYTFSAVNINELGSSEYTLVTIVLDTSGSVINYKTELENCLEEIVKSCKFSPRVDNLMLRLVTFNSNENEIHGFKLFSNCEPTHYKGILKCNGLTSLYDATYNSVNCMTEYGKNLVKNDYSVNGIIFIITDGEDNNSVKTPSDVKDVLNICMNNEYLESLTSILIGVNTNSQISNSLTLFKEHAGLTEYIDLGDANEKKLAKLAKYVSQSIVSQSQNLGNGTTQSQTLSF